MTVKVGIPAQNHDEKFGVNSNYLEFIYQFGRPVVILPESYDDFREIYTIDALLLPGGADINYSRYSLIPKLATNNPNIFLEYFDTQILPNLVGRMPIFGICRGLQTLNVLFGGTLQNIWWNHGYSNFETDNCHKVETNEKTKELAEFGVNSFHHQGIKKLATNFTVEATYIKNKTKDGIIEAISDYSKRIFAVQWHPERLLDSYSMNKFNKILS
jgi:putative glutamine amidotransferase